MMGSGFDDWIYRHFFMVTVNYNSSHNKLLLNDICVTNLFEESRTNLANSRMNSLLYLSCDPNIRHPVKQLILLCYSVCYHGNVFVNICCRRNRCLHVLPSKLTSLLLLLQLIGSVYQAVAKQWTILSQYHSKHV
jgi:hypothetical protein